MPSYVSIVPQVDDGFQSDVHDSWTECEKVVSGKPGAFGRKFLTRDLGISFMTHWRYESKSWQRILRRNEYPIAYVDGSCTAKRKDRPDPQKASWGLSIVAPNGEILHEANGVIDWEKVPGLGQRQIAGEFYGAVKAAEWAKENDQKIIVCFDYWGVCYTALGLWEPKNDLSHWYVKEIQSQQIIAWNWTPGHTGVKGNERADVLAGEALAPWR